MEAPSADVAVTMRTLAWPADLALAAAALRRGELVGMPTETVYGLAGDAFDPRAVAAIFSVKARPEFDPLIVHVAWDAPAGDERASGAGLAALVADGIAGELAPAARVLASRLAAAFWPGPLTLVLPRGTRVPLLVTSGQDTVAVRAPAHPAAQALLRACGSPLAAPSANRFGRISPTCAADVRTELGDRVPWVLDGGACSVGVESTILDLASDPGRARCLRPGGLPLERIAAVIGPAALVVGEGGDGDADQPSAPRAPGSLASHYAPRKPLVLVDDLLAPLPADLPAGPAHLLAMRRPPARFAELLAGLGPRRAAGLESLSDPDDLDGERAAARLFETLRRLDAAPGSDWLLAETWPDERGLGRAIRDRMARAAAPADLRSRAGGS